MRFVQVTWYSKMLAAILFVALPFIGFYTGIKYQQAITTSREVVVNNMTKTKDKNINIKTDQLVLNTTYENGVLKYSGTVQLPTPCHKLKDETGVLQSFPEQVQIRLVVEPPKPGIDCAQVITEKEFSGQVEVSSKAVVSVYLNGTRVK
jgi:hypothetical protein